MKRYKLVFYAIIVVYFSTSVYFGLNINDMFGRFGMFKFLRFLTNWAITGLLLLLVEFAIENIHIFSLNRSIAKAEREILKLKAENYELSKRFENHDEDSMNLEEKSASLSESQNQQI